MIIQKAVLEMNWVEKLYNGFMATWEKSSHLKKIMIFLGIYTVIFGITFVLAYSPFLFNEKTFVWRVDGRGQHFPALVYIGRYLRQVILKIFAGEFAVPMVDYNLALGSDIIATLNYYGFGDPLNFFAIFVPTRYMEYFYCFLVGFRIYLAGLAFVGLCLYHRKRLSHALIGSLVYTFSGFVILSAVRHPFFINPMIQLPLLLIGIDCVIKKRQSMIFAFAVFYSALCGFYFLYMMTIVIGIYALVKFFDYYDVHRIKEFVLMIVRSIREYLLGVGLAAIIFLPAVIGFLLSSRFGHHVERNYISYGWEYYRNNLLKIIAPPGSWDALAVAAIALLAVVILFSLKRKKYKSLKKMFIIGLTIYILPLGGYIMNGFSYPSQRWTFGVALLIAYITVEMFPILCNLNKKQQIICIVVLSVYTLGVFGWSKTRGIYHVVGIAMLAWTSLILVFCAKGNRVSNNKQQIKQNNISEFSKIIVCLVLVMGNVCVNAAYRFAEDQAGYAKEFAKLGDETTQIVNAIEREGEVYLYDYAGRFDGTTFAKNMGMIWHVPTMNSFWSIVNEAVADFWKISENVGQYNTTGFYRTDSRTIFTTLLSNRYCIEKEGREAYIPYGYRLIEKKDSGNNIYENQYALPWGYTYEQYFIEKDLEQLNGLEKQQAMLQGISLKEIPKGNSRGIIENSINAIPYNIKALNDIEWNDEILEVKKGNASIILEYQMPSQVEGYLRLKGLDINESNQSNFNLTINSQGYTNNADVLSDKYTWYFGRENYLFNLGYSEKERTTCTITFPKAGKFKLEDIEIFALSMDKYPEQIENLREEPLENIKMDINQITGTVNLSKNKILCLSIPYSKGWSAKVDGEPVEILRGNYMFMAIPLEAGYHEIEFNYFTPGLRMGFVCTGVSVLIIGRRVWKERRRKV